MGQPMVQVQIYGREMLRLGIREIRSRPLDHIDNKP